MASVPMHLQGKVPFKPNMIKHVVILRIIHDMTLRLKKTVSVDSC